MDRLPLLFLFKNTVQGNGFQAYVTAQGRVLVERGAEAEGEVWVTGVQPGGIAEGARDEHQAYEKFKALYRHVIDDTAAEAKDFDMFTAEVRHFFNEVCGPAEEEWWQAVHVVRMEGYTEESLAKKPAGTPIGVTVERVADDVEQLMLEPHTASEESQQERALAA